MKDECRHVGCAELPKIHAEIIRKHARPGVQWSGDFCMEHGVPALAWQIQSLKNERDRLVVEVWKVQKHGCSREQSKVKRTSSVHEGAWHHA